MNAVLSPPILTTEGKNSDVYFLLALLALIVVQFVLFYFGLPTFANSFNRSESEPIYQSSETDFT